MNKENYFGESAMKDNPKKSIKLEIKNGSVVERKIAENAVTTGKIANSSVTEEKILNGAVTTNKIHHDAVTTETIHDSAVTTDKINDGAVTSDKIAEGAVSMNEIEDLAVVESKIDDKAVTNRTIDDKAVTVDKMAENAIVEKNIVNSSVTESKIGEKAVTNVKIGDAAVDTRIIKDKSVTNEKMADDTLTIDKLDPELRKAINAATGLPEDLVKVIQDVDVSIAKLNDTVYPITLGFIVSPNTGTMQTDVKYSVTSDGKPLVPDTLEVTKQINDNAPKVLTNAKVASGTVQTKIEGGREVFKFAVTKTGRTGKSTLATRYLCYYGGSSVKDMTAETMNTLSKVSSTGVSFNPQINTNNGEYIWLIVPNYLTISRVTSAGFDVTLTAAQTVTNSLSTFKAYRTVNTLTAETWKLVIS